MEEAAATALACCEALPLLPSMATSLAAAIHQSHAGDPVGDNSHIICLHSLFSSSYGTLSCSGTVIYIMISRRICTLRTELRHEAVFGGAGVSVKPYLGRLQTGSTAGDSSGGAGSSQTASLTGSPAVSESSATLPAAKTRPDIISGQRRKVSGDAAKSSPSSASPSKKSLMKARGVAPPVVRKRTGAHSSMPSTRQTTAAAVLKRFAEKLEGRDPDLQRREEESTSQSGAVKSEEKSVETGKEALTVERQVDALLREARSVDNLSRMYEGWTPWL